MGASASLWPAATLKKFRPATWLSTLEMEAAHQIAVMTSKSNVARNTGRRPTAWQSGMKNKLPSAIKRVGKVRRSSIFLPCPGYIVSSWGLTAPSPEHAATTIADYRPTMTISMFLRHVGKLSGSAKLSELSTAPGRRLSGARDGGSYLWDPHSVLGREPRHRLREAGWFR